jgi:NADPH2:quinone reductase
VLVRVVRAGVNFIDVYMRSGIYARSDTYVTPLPMTIGMEGAGIVEAVGDGVKEWSAGDRVAYCLARGSYADFALVPHWRLVPVPETIGFDAAAALMLQGSTAHYLTHSAYPIKPGDVCLVHAGAGGVGQLLIQLAKLRGATVITTVGSPDKADLARSRGADHCILYRDEDVRERVLALTEGRGVHVAYDSVGLGHHSQEHPERAPARLVRPVRGQFRVVPSIEPIELAEAGSVFFTRPHLADYMVDAEEVRWRAGDLFGAVAEGRLDAAIHDVMPLEDAGAAHRLIEGRGTRGKLLLEVA